MSQTKETNIENRTLYIFDDMINVKTFDVSFFFVPGFCFANIHESQDCK